MVKSRSAHAPGDAGGHRRGALGIDDDKDVGFQIKGVDKAAQKRMYGEGNDPSATITGEEAK
jgi:hypothetical protein